MTTTRHQVPLERASDHVWRALGTTLVLLAAVSCSSTGAAVSRLQARNREVIGRLAVALSAPTPEVKAELLADYGQMDPDRPSPEWTAKLQEAQKARAQELRGHFETTTSLEALLTHKEFVLRAELYEELATPHGKILLREALRKLQAEFDQGRKQARNRATELVALDRKIREALEQLDRNGRDIQEYLDLPWYKRLWTDVQGLDREKLKQMGEQLKEIKERLEPLLSGFLDRGEER